LNLQLLLSRETLQPLDSPLGLALRSVEVFLGQHSRKVLAFKRGGEYWVEIQPGAEDGRRVAV
jgi:hypothetical protein